MSTHQCHTYKHHTCLSSLLSPLVSLDLPHLHTPDSLPRSCPRHATHHLSTTPLTCLRARHTCCGRLSTVPSCVTAAHTREPGVRELKTRLSLTFTSRCSPQVWAASGRRRATSSSKNLPLLSHSRLVEASRVECRSDRRLRVGVWWQVSDGRHSSESWLLRCEQRAWMSRVVFQCLLASCSRSSSVAGFLSMHPKTHPMLGGNRLPRGART